MEIGPTSLLPEPARQACLSAREALLGQRYEDVSCIDRLAGEANEAEVKGFYGDLSTFLKGNM